MSDNAICTGNKSGNIENRTNIGTNKMKILRKIVGKTKIDRIRSQQIRESCGIQPNTCWMERRIRKWVS